jgi:hypothetical protein
MLQWPLRLVVKRVNTPFLSQPPAGTSKPKDDTITYTEMLVRTVLLWRTAGLNVVGLNFTKIKNAE